MPKLRPKLQTAHYSLNKLEALRTQLLRRIDRNDGWNVMVNQRDDGKWTAQASNLRRGQGYIGEPQTTALDAIGSLRIVLENNDIRIAL